MVRYSLDAENFQWYRNDTLDEEQYEFVNENSMSFAFNYFKIFTARVAFSFLLLSMSFLLKFYQEALWNKKFAFYTIDTGQLILQPFDPKPNLFAAIKKYNSLLIFFSNQMKVFDVFVLRKSRTSILSLSVILIL